MPDTDFAAVRFMPWVRQGVAAIADGGAAQVQFKINADEVAMPIRLLGPATVTGIDPKQVIRMEPRPAPPISRRTTFRQSSLTGRTFRGCSHHQSATATTGSGRGFVSWSFANRPESRYGSSRFAAG